MDSSPEHGPSGSSGEFGAGPDPSGPESASFDFGDSSPLDPFGSPDTSRDGIGAFDPNAPSFVPYSPDGSYDYDATDRPADPFGPDTSRPWSPYPTQPVDGTEYIARPLRASPAPSPDDIDPATVVPDTLKDSPFVLPHPVPKKEGDEGYNDPNFDLTVQRREILGDLLDESSDKSVIRSSDWLDEAEVDPRISPYPVERSLGHNEGLEPDEKHPRLDLHQKLDRDAELEAAEREHRREINTSQILQDAKARGDMKAYKAERQRLAAANGAMSRPDIQTALYGRDIDKEAKAEIREKVSAVQAERQAAIERARKGRRGSVEDDRPLVDLSEIDPRFVKLFDVAKLTELEQELRERYHSAAARAKEDEDRGYELEWDEEKGKFEIPHEPWEMIKAAVKRELLYENGFTPDLVKLGGEALDEIFRRRKAAEAAQKARRGR